MILVCRACRANLSPDTPDCHVCGTPLLRAYAASAHAEIYQILARANLMTDNASAYRRRTYPLDGSNPLNVVFGSFFTTGYILRVSEECMNNMFQRDPVRAAHPAQIKAILLSAVSTANMTAAIAGYFDREVLGALDDAYRDATLRKYELLDFDASGQFVDFVLADSLKQHESLVRSSRLDADVIHAVLCKNALLGYYFRVAEELVEGGARS